MHIYAMVGDGLQQVGGECPSGWIEMKGERPGDGFIAAEGGEWVEVLPEVPPSVSRYQGREAMLMTRFAKEGSPGWTLLDAFEELLNESTTPAYYRRAWEQLQVFERSSAMLNASADVLGLSQAKLDDLFRLAAALKA